MYASSNSYYEKTSLKNPFEDYCTIKLLNFEELNSRSKEQRHTFKNEQTFKNEEMQDQPL